MSPTKKVRDTKKNKQSNSRSRPAPLNSYSVPRNFDIDLTSLFAEFGKKAGDDVVDRSHNDLVQAALEYWTERDQELRGALSLSARREYLRKTHKVLKRARDQAEKLRLLWNEMPAEAERLLLPQTSTKTLARFSSNDFRDTALGGNCLDEFCRIASQVDAAITRTLTSHKGADIDITKHVLVEHLAKAYYSLTNRHPARNYSSHLKDRPAGETGPFYRFVRLFEEAMLKSFHSEIEARKKRRPDGEFPSADAYGLGTVERIIRAVAEQFRLERT